MGRYLIIEKTKPKTDRPAHLPVDEDSKTIFVGNLSFKTDTEVLKRFFASCGKVADARIAQADGKVLFIKYLTKKETKNKWMEWSLWIVRYNLWSVWVSLTKYF